MSTEQLYKRVARILEKARSQVARTVNTAMVHAYWHVGREIVEVALNVTIEVERAITGLMATPMALDAARPLLPRAGGLYAWWIVDDVLTGVPANRHLTLGRRGSGRSSSYCWRPICAGSVPDPACSGGADLVHCARR